MRGASLACADGRRTCRGRRRAGLAVALFALALASALVSCAPEADPGSDARAKSQDRFEVSDALLDAEASFSPASPTRFLATREDSVQAIDAINALPGLDEAADAPSAASGGQGAGNADASSAVAGESAAAAQAVSAAYDAFAEHGFEASFVVYDYAAKTAVGRNVDAEYFCASTIKAPFAAYVATDVVEAGAARPEDEMVETEVVEGSGTMDTDGETVYALGEVVDNMLVFSDNTAYRMLWRAFGGEGFEAWAADWGVDVGSWAGAEYVFYSARDLAKLWVGVFDCLSEDARNQASASSGERASGSTREPGVESSGASSAEPSGDAGGRSGSSAQSLSLAADLVRTQSSLLRKTLDASAFVVSKPGFESNSYHAGEPYDMGALHDAGVVGFQKGSCLIVVMSNIDYDDEFETENEWLVTDLISALAAACEQGQSRL